MISGPSTDERSGPSGRTPADPHAAGNDLSVRIYRRLRRLAARYMRAERKNHTLSPTALVHEAFIRLADGNRPDGLDREQFFALAARQMRRALVDHARARGAQKRGGGVLAVSLNDGHAPTLEVPVEILALNEALIRLRELSQRQEKVFELHFFAGLGQAEIAEVLGVSERTVRNDWRVSRVWLASELFPDRTRPK